MEQTVQNEKTGKLLEVKDLRVSFFTPAGEVKAVSGISYDLDYDEVMGIVGESGSGKSQEAYSIMGLLQSPGKVIGGSITFEGRDVLSFGKNEMAAFRGAGAGGHQQRAEADEAVPPRVLRRHAPARHDRHGPHLPPQAAHRR